MPVYLKGPNRFEYISATGHNYIFFEDGIVFPKSLDKLGRKIFASEGTVN